MPALVSARSNVSVAAALGEAPCFGRSDRAERADRQGRVVVKRIDIVEEPPLGHNITDNPIVCAADTIVEFAGRPAARLTAIRSRACAAATSATLPHVLLAASRRRRVGTRRAAIPDYETDFPLSPARHTRPATGDQRCVAKTPWCPKFPPSFPSSLSPSAATYILFIFITPQFLVFSVLFA